MTQALVFLTMIAAGAGILVLGVWIAEVRKRRRGESSE